MFYSLRCDLFLHSICSCLSSTIAAYQNGSGWTDNLVAGAVTGSLGGYLAQDLKAVGLENIVKRTKVVGGPLSVPAGLACGLAFGSLVGLYSVATRNRKRPINYMYWENYWKEQKEVHSIGSLHRSHFV